MNYLLKTEWTILEECFINIPLFDNIMFEDKDVIRLGIEIQHVMQRVIKQIL